jgi:VanZ family protein
VSDSSSGAEARRFHPIPALLALAWAGGIFWESCLSSDQLGVPGGPFWGFLANSFHFFLFGVLAILIAEALRTEAGLTRGRAWAVVLLVLAYGISDELHQGLFTPGRSGDAGDVCIDLLGGLGGLALWWGVRGEGRLLPSVARLLAVGGAAAAFNAWRAWGPKHPT